MPAKVLLAMSGGIDSSVSLLLLKKQGYQCVGMTMLLTAGKENDLADAQRIAALHGVPHTTVDYRHIFCQSVIKPFVAAYEAGMTPNPCVNCNRTIKFGALFKEMQERGLDYLATGHYARIESKNGQYYLAKARDEKKDQSYFLYTLTQDQLKHLLFPLGELTKDEVRQIAKQNNFPNASKAESQDICFVPNNDYAKVIQDYGAQGSLPGDFVDQTGKAIGQHKGIIHYTIGQRRGLGIPAENRLYVCKISPEKNIVYLGAESDLYCSRAKVQQVNWINGVPQTKQIHCMVKTRYRQNPQPATIQITSDTEVEIVFEQPQRAITPGQSAVFYQDQFVLGGGIISVV